MTFKPSRSEFIDGKYLYVFDDLFSKDQVDKFHHSLLIANYSCLQASKAETRKYKEWVSSFDKEDLKNHWLQKTCGEIVVQFLKPDYEFEFSIGFGNLFSFGSFTFSHADSDSSTAPNKAISFLYYANSIWEKEWGGETIFFDKKNEPLLCVGVKPGRLIVFPGDLTHRSGIPTRFCHEHRMTFSIRFAPKE